MNELRKIENGLIKQDLILNKIYIAVKEGEDLKILDVNESLISQFIVENSYGSSYIFNNWLITNYFDDCGIYNLYDLDIKEKVLKSKNFQGFINNHLFCSFSTQLATMSSVFSIIDIITGKDIKQLEFGLEIIFIKSTHTNIFLRNRRLSNLICLDSKNLYQKWEINFDIKVSQRNEIRFIAEKENFTLFQVKYNWMVALNNESGQIEWEVSKWYNIDNMEFLGLGMDIYHYHFEVNKLHVFQESGYFCLDFESKKFKQYYDIRRDETYKYLSILTSTYSEGKFYFTAERRNPNETKYIYEGCNIVGIFDVATLRMLEIQELELANQETLHTAPVVDEKYVYIQGSEGNVYIFEKQETA